RRGPDGGRVASEDPKPLAFLSFLESEASESQKHTGATLFAPIEFAETGNFISARSRRPERVQPEEHRGRAPKMREVRLRQGVLRPALPRQLSDPRLRLSEVRPRRGPGCPGLVRLSDREGRHRRRVSLREDVDV